nr:YggT family protein [Corynebacterium phoceense]
MGVSEIGIILYALIRLFSFALIIRIIVEMVASFSRNFRPPRWFTLVAEPLFAVTDPPVKGLRKIIPPLRLGNVSLDVSIIVLFLLLGFLSTVIVRTLV